MDRARDLAEDGVRRLRHLDARLDARGRRRARRSVLSSRVRSEVMPRRSANASRAIAERDAASSGAVISRAEHDGRLLAARRRCTPRGLGPPTYSSKSPSKPSAPIHSATATRSGWPPRASTRSFFADAERARASARAPARWSRPSARTARAIGPGVERVGDLGHGLARRARSAAAPGRARRCLLSSAEMLVVVLRPSATSAPSVAWRSAGVLAGAARSSRGSATRSASHRARARAPGSASSWRGRARWCGTRARSPW